MKKTPQPMGAISRELSLQMDRDEGAEIDQLILDSPRQIKDDPLVVPDDLQRNLLVTSVDALVSWGRKNSMWPVMFGLAGCAFDMIG
ncbi:MAG: hypothetical protein IIB12_10090, partial [Chloroflexi bacterium]|nr:hypothetical protein [Chloroflexota bacterium]